MLTPARQNDSMFYLGATLAGVVVWAALMVMYGLLVVRPMLASDRQNSEDATHLTEMLAASGEVYQNHRKLRGELDALEARITATHARVPDAPDDADFLRQVTDIADREGVTIVDYSQASTVTHATHSELQIQLTCSADYVPLCRFLHAIEELPRLTKVAALAVQKSSADEPPQVMLTYVLYFGIVADTATTAQLRTEALR